MEAAVESPPKENAECTQPDKKPEEKTPTPPPQDAPKKSKKEDRAKKDEKSVEQFMKSLNSIPSLEDKLALVCQKYVETASDNKKMQFYIKQSDKRFNLQSKEKEQLQHEFNKMILVKAKLENLCRELQKQNKAIKEESLLKIREEEERRKETQAKFQSTLAEITTLLQQNNEKNTKLRDDNISMTDKFKGVVQQYQLREQQVEKMAKQMALEQQLSDAKMQKASLEHQAEKGRLLADMEQLKMEVAQYQAKMMELQGTEAALRGQIGVYTEKYDEFQNALVKSNQVFGGFKAEMDKMSKKILKLEKESLSWKKRWETSQTALIDMCSDRQATEERAASANRQLANMQGLCRTLQAERTVLLATLKENNIERPPLPTPPPAPPAPAPAPAAHPGNTAKVDAMAVNCAQLKQSLAQLQNQLNVLTTKNEPKTEPAKSEKKKSKSKKNKREKSQDKEAAVTENDASGKVAVTEVVENEADNEVEVTEAVGNEADDKVEVTEVVGNEVGKVEEAAPEGLIEDKEAMNGEDVKSGTENGVRTDISLKNDANVSENYANVVKSVIVTKEDVKVAKTDEKVAKTDANVTNAEAIGAKVDANITQVDAKAAKTDVIVTKTEANTDAFITQVDTKAATPDANDINVAAKAEKTDANDTKVAVNVIDTNDATKIDGNANDSFVDPSSNDEIPHILEVKSILTS